MDNKNDDQEEREHERRLTEPFTQECYLPRPEDDLKIKKYFKQISEIDSWNDKFLFCIV